MNDVDNVKFVLLLMLDILLTREKVGVPTGIFPLAFSDIPRSCVGTASSTDDDIDGVREWLLGTEDSEWCTADSWWSSASESSSSPIAKAPSSSGTLLNEGVLALTGLRIVSMELVRVD